MTPTHPMTPTTRSREEASTGALIREAVDEAKALAHIEIELAKDEVRRELRDAKNTAFAMSAAAVLALEGLALVLVALALTIGFGPFAALILGIVLLAAGGAQATSAGAWPRASRSGSPGGD